MKTIHTTLLGLAALLTLSLSACSDHITDNWERETRLQMIDGETGVYSRPDVDTLQILPPYTQLYRFDKRDYEGVTSISFLTLMATGHSENPAIAKLYNVTDGQVIEESRVTTASTELVWVESGNILDKLPDKPITLGIVFSNMDNSRLWKEPSFESSASIFEATVVVRRN